MDVARRLEVVEQENLLLRERVASLLAILTDLREPAPIEWGLTSTEACVFGVLVNREIATKDAIMVALYAGKASADEVPHIKIVDVLVCKLRRKLKGHNIDIQTVWGRGYALDAYTRARFHQVEAVA